MSLYKGCTVVQRNSMHSMNSRLHKIETEFRVTSKYILGTVTRTNNKNNHQLRAKKRHECNLRVQRRYTKNVIKCKAISNADKTQVMSIV